MNELHLKISNLEQQTKEFQAVSEEINVQKQINDEK